MILNYKFQNFLSFQDNVEFSMMAPNTEVKNRFPDNYVHVAPACDILKTAVIVGENAGGKSNFVESLGYLKDFFRENDEVKSYRDMIHINNVTGKCAKKGDTCQQFEVEVWLEQRCFYRYHLELDFAGIVKEELGYKGGVGEEYEYIFKVIRDQLDLDCDKDGYPCTGDNQCKTKAFVDYDLDIPSYGKEMEELISKAVTNWNQMGLFITKLAILGNEHAFRFSDWVKNSLCPETNSVNYGLYKSMRNEEEDFTILNDPRFLEIFQMVDRSIIGIKLDEERPFYKTMVIRKKKDGGTFSRELGRDSSGVREFFAWAVQIFKIVYENKVVFADEIDRVLNPVLSERVAAFVNGKQHCGQFIFTTHNALHLDLKNYMKEQIYFITKDVESLESELYSLADFPEVEYEETKIYEFYMKGILGGTVVE